MQRFVFKASLVAAQDRTRYTFFSLTRRAKWANERS